MVTPQTSRTSTAALVVTALLLALAAGMRLASNAPWGSVAVVVAVALLVPLLRVRTLTRGDVLLVRMAPFPTKVIHIADIHSISVEPPMPWSGIGYRWYGPGMWGMVTGGPELTLGHGRDQMLVLSCSDPDELARQLAARVRELTGKDVLRAQG